ncbi:MAG: thioesterase family protein [Flavobacteriaceae bacterium]|nr:thioesterase family protein [Flavobacteriaceae bacterium]
MKFTKKFEIRWSDLDANRHLANSAYQNFMSHTRMAFLIESGMSSKQLVKLGLGPVVFYEHIYYFKEIMPEDSVTVSVELKGLSEDGMFFEFVHNLYNQQGKNCARAEMLGAWIDLKSRKLAPLPQDLMNKIKKLEATEDFKVLTQEDTRKHKVYPKDL